MLNSQSIKDKLKRISKDSNVGFNILLREYMYERFIVRLANSKYRDNFIIKGGYLLSLMYGVESRSTMDIDACLKNQKLDESNLLKIVEEISNVKIKGEENIIIKIEGV